MSKITFMIFLRTTSIIVNYIPESSGGFLPIIVGVISMPVSLLFDPDSFY